jgi:hypothetical protein
MSVPTHNLYDFVHQLAKNQLFLMYFYPWGSRDLRDVHLHLRNDCDLVGTRSIALSDRIRLPNMPDQILDWRWLTTAQPVMFCHDQEPLNFNLYSDSSPNTQEFLREFQQRIGLTLSPDARDLNLRWTNPTNLQKKWILLHSELNSKNLDCYEATGQYQGAYWWSHAVIARDWYRYAEHDNSLKPDTIQRTFLAYCRDVTGSRHYRQDFLSLISSNKLVDHCQIQSFDQQPVGPDASAVYNHNDFNNTAISVVLETVFDERIHLTEKILRPIACGHPFILAAGAGSLSVLRSYGFHTFVGYINEDYDDIEDSKGRLNAIVQEMKRIQNMPPQQRQTLINTCRQIAEYNRKLFFSQKFFDLVSNELISNVGIARSLSGDQLNFGLWQQERSWRQNIGSATCQSGSDPYADYILQQINRDE